MAVMVVAVMSSVYVFTGCSKEEYIKFLNTIPAQNFGYLIIPTIIMAYAAGVWLFYKLFETAHPEEPTIDLKQVVGENIMHVEK